MGTKKDLSGLDSLQGKRRPNSLDETFRDTGLDASVVSNDMERAQTHCDQSRSLETVIFLFLCPAAFTAGMDTRLSAMPLQAAGWLLVPDPLLPGTLLAPLRTPPSGARFRSQPTRRTGRRCAGPLRCFSPLSPDSSFHLCSSPASASTPMSTSCVLLALLGGKSSNLLGH